LLRAASGADAGAVARKSHAAAAHEEALRSELSAPPTASSPGVRRGQRAARREQRPKISTRTARDFCDLRRHSQARRWAGRDLSRRGRPPRSLSKFSPDQLAAQRKSAYRRPSAGLGLEQERQRQLERSMQRSREMSRGLDLGTG
jgi:hypothetical protein